MSTLLPFIRRCALALALAVLTLGIPTAIESPVGSTPSTKISLGAADDSTTTSTQLPVTTTTFPPTVGNTVQVPGEPNALLRAGGNIWVASCTGDALTEINSSTKQIIQQLDNSDGQNYEFDCPDALALVGSNIWVANYDGNSLTELNASNGALVTTLTGRGIINPIQLSTHILNGESGIWVLSAPGNISNITLAEFNTSNGELLRITIQKASNSWLLTEPDCMISTGTTLWISDFQTGEVLEFSANSGAFLRSTHGGPQVGYFSSVSYQDGRLWVSTEDDFHVEVEFNAVTGAFVKEIFSPLIPNSNQIVSAGADVFVVSDNPNDSVIEFNSNTRKLVRIIDRSNLGHGQGIKALLVDGSELWVANYTAGSVSFFRT